MAAYYITSLLTVISSLGLGIFVLYKNSRNPIHRSLFRLNLVVALWSFFLFCHYISKTYSVAFISLRLLHAFVVFIPACYLHFVTDLLGVNKKRIIRLSYIICATMLFLTFSPSFITGVEQKMYFRFYATAGNMYFLWIASYLLISGYGLCLMLKNYSSSAPIKKIQIKYVIFASLIGFLGGATIYPLLYNINIPPLGEHIIFLYPIIFAVAVLKHNVLELNLVIKRTLVYSVSLILITLLYIVSVFILERLLRNIIGYQSFWVTLIAAVGIAILFNPVKNHVQSAIERIYIKNAYQRLQKELVESDKSKALASLAAGLAHEIRNPLTAINTFAEYLPEKFNDKDFRKKFSRIITGEVGKINALISQLLEFAKPSTLHFSRVNIHELLDYTLNLLSAEILKSKIQLVKEYTKKNPIIEADTNKLNHVFFNITKNAIESMDTGGRLTVKTSSSKNNLKIIIGDTGCGISGKDLSRVFEPFFSAKDKGTGLGLAVAETIISEHAGNISAESKLGRGTAFTITLKK